MPFSELSALSLEHLQCVIQAAIFHLVVTSGFWNIPKHTESLQDGHPNNPEKIPHNYIYA